MATAVVPYIAPLLRKAVLNPRNAAAAVTLQKYIRRHLHQGRYVAHAVKTLTPQAVKYWKKFVHAKDSPYVRRKRKGLFRDTRPTKRPTMARRYTHKRLTRAQAKAQYRKKKGKNKAKFSRTNIGHPRGAGAVKTRKTDDLVHNLTTRTLVPKELTELASTEATGTASNGFGRGRNLVFFKGFKICASFENNSGLPQINLNWAIVSPKSGTSVTNSEFFRSDLNASRGMDFSQYLDSTDFHCAGINTDRYVVLRHQRIKLGKDHTSTLRCSRTVNRYIKLNRQLRYESETSTTPLADPVFFVYWCDVHMNPANTVPLINAVKVQLRLHSFFTEPGSNL